MYSKFVRLNVSRTPSTIFMVGIGIFILVYLALNPELGIFYLFLGIVFTTFPLVSYFAIGKGYENNKHFSERLEIQVSSDSFELKGQTFRIRI